MASLDMKQLLAEIEKTTHKMSVIDQELDDLFSSRVHLEQRVKLNTVQKGSNEMSISGREISKQVSELDIAETRIQNVLFRVSLMLDLKKTMKNVEECINDFKYEIAAKETHRMLHENKDNTAQIDEISFEIFSDLEYRLGSLIEKACDKAQSCNNFADIFKYCSLYRYFGDEMMHKGLNIYCFTINKELKLTLFEQNLTMSSQAKDSIIPYVKIIGGYIDQVFTAITQNENELKLLFSGCNPIFALVQILHNETDLEISALLNHYLRRNGINDLVHKIVEYNRCKQSSEYILDEFETIKAITSVVILDKILDEISQISQELMAYDTTIKELIKSNEFDMRKMGIIRTRLTGDYILLEEFNMMHEIYRILVFDETSTLSGNIYFLLKTLAIRSFNTYDVNVSCAIINNICTLLDSVYKEYLDKEIKRDRTKSLYNRLKSDNTRTIILLNTIDASILDTDLIRNQLFEEVNDIFEDVSEKDKFKMHQTLNGFDDIKKSFETIIEREIKLYSATFYGILTDSLNAFKEYDFEITDKEFNKNSASPSNESFVDILIDSSRPTFYALSKRLTNANFDRILILILSYYLGELERFVLNHRFTFWGGMQFDKKRQKLQQYLYELTNTKSIRDEFIRIRCIAEILQFSNINEATNYLNNKTLTKDEIKKILSLRTEFNHYEIQQLKI